MTWTVYTVTDHPGGGWAVLATRWTEDGPDDGAKTVARLVDMTRQEAEAEAAEMQRRYDKLRNAMAPR